MELELAAGFATLLAPENEAPDPAEVNPLLIEAAQAYCQRTNLRPETFKDVDFRILLAACAPSVSGREPLYHWSEFEKQAKAENEEHARQSQIAAAQREVDGLAEKMAQLDIQKEDEKLDCDAAIKDLRDRWSAREEEFKAVRQTLADQKADAEKRLKEITGG